MSESHDAIIDQITGGPEAPVSDEVVEDQSKPETPVEAVEAPKEEVEKPAHTVPVGALAEERARRREAQQERDALVSKIAKMETLFEQLQKGSEQPKPVPSRDEDPVNYFEAQIKALQEKLDGYEKKTSVQTEEQARQQHEQQLLSRYHADVQSYAAKAPDFQDAYQWLAQTIDKDLAARGIDDPAERSRLIQYEEGLMVGRAMAADKSPAELVYNYAKARGYQGKVDANKLDTIERGQRAARSLGGSNPDTADTISLARLAELEGAAFDTAWAKLKKTGKLG